MLLLDVETGRCLREFESNGRVTTSVAFSADDSRAVSGNLDNAVHLWDVETGQCIRVFEGHTASVMSVTWTANQRHALLWF